MSVTEATLRLTHGAALQMLSAAVDAAQSMGQPQCIVIVDASCVPVAELRMTGAKVLSLDSARTKARTAASTGAPTNAIPPDVRPAIAAATGGAMTGLPGGLPIRIAGTMVGGIGVGSGRGDQDVAVAEAALRAIGADLSEAWA